MFSTLNRNIFTTKPGLEIAKINFNLSYLKSWLERGNVFEKFYFKPEIS